MFQTLTEALEANSLEHKLEMQIKASLEEGVVSGSLLNYIDKDKYKISKYDISKANSLIQYLIKEYLHNAKNLLTTHVSDEKQFIMRYKSITGRTEYTSPSGKTATFRATKDITVYAHLDTYFIQQRTKDGFTYIFT